MKARDTFDGKRNDAAALRKRAADCRQREQDSFERSDTDGFLSQWANSMSAQLYDRQADIADAGGRATFTGLWTVDGVRVRAKLVTQPKYNAPWVTVHVWELHLVDAVKYGRKFVPAGDASRVQKQLGLHERQELAPAVACMSDDTEGGLYTRCANAYVTIRRTGDAWGSDAILKV